MMAATLIGITKQLKLAFGLPVYVDEIKQGLVPPCFLVTLVAGGQEQALGTLYTRRQRYCIHYFPAAAAPAQEIAARTDALLMAMEYITVGGTLVRGTDMETKTSDGVLLVLVDYDIRVRKVVDPDPTMATLTHTGGIKHG